MAVAFDTPAAVVYVTKELSLDTLGDFEALAKKQGGCWCVYYQRERPLRRGSTPSEWERSNRRDKEKFIREGKAHAILVYEGAEPVGWCQYGPKEELPRIDAGRFYRKLPGPTEPSRLWRITCFFVDRQHRRRGVARAGLAAALESIRKQGGGVVEGYPVVSRKMAADPIWLWFGTPGMFEDEGFSRVAKLGTSRVLVRLKVG